MLALFRILLMIALAVVTVSTAQHAHAAQQSEAHAAHSGHTHDGEGGHERDCGHDPTVCCPSLSLHCGAAAALQGDMWGVVARLPVAISQCLRESAELIDTLPEFEPPPPRS